MSAPANPLGAQQIDTRFGPFSVEEPRVIYFPAGLPGFERCRQFVLIVSPDLEPLTCLQALDSPYPSFLAVDPALVDPAFAPTLGPFERARLEVGPSDTLLWLLVVTMGTPPDPPTVNCRAPIVINSQRMLGCQVILEENALPVDRPIHPK